MTTPAPATDLAAAYEAYAPRVLAYLRRRVGDDAADIASDVWLRYVERVRGGLVPAEPLALLYHIARQRAIGYYQWRTVRRGDRRVGEDDLHRAPDSAARVDAARALAALSPRERAVVWCRFWAGYDRHETAATLGLTYTTVRDTQARAMGRMRAALGVRSEAMTE